MVRKVVLVILILAALVAGYFLYLYMTAEPGSMRPTDERSGWKTYTDVYYEMKYPEKDFALFEISKSLLLDNEYTGVKLISAARVEKLGKKECSYGQSGLTSLCTKEMEGGIEFILVDSSVPSLTSFLDSSLTTMVTIAGKESIKWSIGAEGEGTDYYYISISPNQTLVVVRLYRSDGFPDKNLFDQVMNTLVLSGTGEHLPANPGNELTGLESIVLPDYCTSSTTSGVSWIIDCGKSTQNNARGFMDTILKSQGWKFCGVGLSSAHWWKDGVISYVSESENNNDASSYPFTMSQREGPECESEKLP